MSAGLFTFNQPNGPAMSGPVTRGLIEIRDRERGVVLCRVDRNTLEGADLSGTNLPYAALTGANLHLASLRRARLWGAELIGADLRGADLRGANLGHANLEGAKLAGINLDGCRYNASTRWPDGFDPSEWGALLVD
jgi:uncharacterized protein YjbI with pentapeptide repeats